MKEKNLKDNKSTNLYVKGMTCSGCEFNVENAIKRLNGIVKVKANHKRDK